jgi:hypothetical protein
MSAQDALEAASVALTASGEAFTYAVQYGGEALGYLVSMINETYETFPGPRARPISPSTSGSSS